MSPYPSCWLEGRMIFSNTLTDSSLTTKEICLNTRNHVNILMEDSKTQVILPLRIDAVVGKYYCRLCETSYPDLKRHVQCSECALFYCEGCVEEIINVGLNECPYCDTPFSECSIDINNAQSQSTLKNEFSPDVSFEKSKSIWTEDQIELLKYSLDNVFTTISKSIYPRTIIYLPPFQ